MKIAILSDIHGNIFALKKCIEYIENHNIDNIIFCGDYISDVPKSHDVLLYLKEINKKYNCFFIKGNREDYIIDYLSSKKQSWTMENRHGPMLCTLKELDDSDIKFINELPNSIELDMDGINSIFVSHKKMVIDKKVKYYIYGHTHRPHFNNDNGIIYINPGSVGLGLSNGFCAEFVILKIEDNFSDLQFININYDVEELLKCINDSELLNTKIRWDQILINTIKDGKDYSELYIKNVLEYAKKFGINNIDDIPINMWNDVRKEMFN